MKRIVAFILTLALLVSVPVFSFAEEAENVAPLSASEFILLSGYVYDSIIESWEAPLLPIELPEIDDFKTRLLGERNYSAQQGDIFLYIILKDLDGHDDKSPLSEATVGLAFSKNLPEIGNTALVLFLATIYTITKDAEMDNNFDILNYLLSEKNQSTSKNGLRESSLEKDGVVWTLSISTTVPSFDLKAQFITLDSTAEEIPEGDSDEALQSEEEKQSYSKTSGLSRPKTSGASNAGEATIGEKNALKAAGEYLDVMSFSYSSLVEQLEYEGYSNSEAKYAADNCGADWNEQAAGAAKEYLDVMAFSRSGLIEQLMFAGFTQAQAEYGVTQAGY